MSENETQVGVNDGVLREIDWKKKTRPVRPMLDFLPEQDLALTSLPLYPRGDGASSGGAASTPKTYTIAVTRDRRLCIPTAEFPMRIAVMPMFVDQQSRWREEELRQFLEGTYLVPEPGELFARLVSAFDKYLDLADPTEAKLLSAWVLTSYWTGLWPCCAYLKAQGSMASGKSRLLALLNQLTFNPVTVSNVTTAALVRLTNGGPATCLIDEQENLGATTQREMRLIIQAGYKQQGGDVVRCVGRRLVRYSVFGMKALASIAPLPADGVLASRCIVLKMFSSTNATKTSLKLNEDSEDWAALRAAIFATALTRWRDVLAAEVPAIAGPPRTVEIYGGMLQVAQLVDATGALAVELAGYASRSTTPVVETVPLTDDERKVIDALAGLAAQAQGAWLTSDQLKMSVMLKFPELAGMTTSTLGLLLAKHRLWSQRRHTVKGKVFLLDAKRLATLAIRPPARP